MSNGENSLTCHAQEDYSMLDKIASDNQSFEDIKMLTSSKVTDQLKVFLIAQARRELTRVVTLTKFLDKLEYNFMNKVNDKMINDELSLKQYNEVICTITSLLSRSNEIVTRILKDDSLTTILNTTLYASSGTKTTSVVSNLKDAHSRERVRAVLQQTIMMIESHSKSPEDDLDIVNEVVNDGKSEY